MLFLMASSSFKSLITSYYFFFCSLIPNLETRFAFHLSLSTVVFWFGCSDCLCLKEGVLTNYIQAGCTCLP